MLSGHGRIVDELWHAIPDHYKNVGLGEFVTMPDHFHGIIVLCEWGGGVETGHGIVETGHGIVETGHAPSLRPTLGNIIGSFKSAVTNRIRSGGTRNFAWQERYYDRVIRDDDELRRIEQYIRENPGKWMG